MQRETSVYLCLWAGSFHSGQQEPFPVAKSKHWDTGEDGGVRTKMLVGEPSCHSLLSLSSPYPLLPLFQSSDFSSLFFLVFFLSLFFFISWRLITLQYCRFLSYIDMNQPWILPFFHISFSPKCELPSLQKQTLQFLKLVWYTAHVFRLLYKLKLLPIDEEGTDYIISQVPSSTDFPGNFQNPLMPLPWNGPL